MRSGWLCGVTTGNGASVSGSATAGKPMKTTGLQAMFSRNLSGDRFRPTFVRFEVNPDQACWDLKARGIHWNQEEMMTLTTEENDPKNTVRPWFLNRQLLTGFGTLLRTASTARNGGGSDAGIENNKRPDCAVQTPARAASVCQSINCISQ